MGRIGQEISVKFIPGLLLLLAIGIMGGCSSTVVKHEIKAEGWNQKTNKPIELEPVADKIDPEAFFYWSNGTIYEAAGMYYQASESYRRALAIYPDSYEIRRTLAEVLFKIQHFDDVLAVLQPISPVTADVWELRGATMRAIGSEDSALVCYRESVKLDSSSSSAFSYLAAAYRRLGMVDSTAWAYEHLCRLRPNNYRLWFELGKLEMQLADFEKAETAFRKSLEIRNDITNTMSLIGLSDIYKVRKQPDSARQVLKEALEIDSSNVIVYRQLASIYIQGNQLDSALIYTRKEASLMPLDKPTMRRLGMLYFYLDSLNTADSVFSALVSDGDRHPLNYRYLGRIALTRKNFDDALQDFELLVQLEDSSYENWLDLAYTYRQLEQEENEIKTYQTGLNHIPESDSEGKHRLLFGLAIAYDNYGKFDKAVETFEELIALAANYHQALNYLGYLLAEHGVRLSYARELIERALKESPNNPAYLDSYGWVFYRLGEFDKALEQLKKAVELDNDPVIFDHLGDTYKATGDMNKARVWWKKALELDPENEALKEKLGL